MKPLNAAETGCTPISSNCVIWQGPDIACINLCKGDTVSAVVYKLATELCNLLDQTNVSSYDLSCLNIVGCTPANFEELIQLLINRICALEECCNQNTPTRTPITGCPDCIVNICPAFYYTNPAGDTMTTMQLSDYVQAIGLKVCSIVNDIVTINAILQNHETRITILENTPPPIYTPPTVTPICVLPSVPTQMNLVLSALEQQFCLLVTATGQPSDIFSAILAQCPGLNSAPQLGGAGTMSAIPGWVNSVQTLADSINNLWLTICDLRAAVTNIQVNCCPSGCDGIVLGMYTELSGSNLTIWVNGSIPSGFTQCPPTFLTTVTITDQSGNTVTYTNMDLISILNSPAGILYDLTVTPINTADSLTITLTPCLTKDGNVCNYVLTDVAPNEALCPTLVYSSTDTTISYSGTILTGGTATYSVQLYDSTGTILLSTQTATLTAPPAAPLSGTFSGLIASTIYLVRIVVTSGSISQTCPFTPVTTATSTCPPPSDVTSSINITIL
jgi:hypothetical protein